MALARIDSRTKTHGMSDPSPEVVELDPHDAVAMRGDVLIADLPDFFERAFATVAAVVEAGFRVSKPVEGVADAHPFGLPGARGSRRSRASHQAATDTGRVPAVDR
jgi:hypothetical protein